MDRRRFIVAAGAASAAAAGARHAVAAEATPAKQAAPASRRFTLNYAPHFGMFRASAGSDPVDQLKFAADQGFRAWEDNGMKDRPLAEQQRLAAAMERLGIEMGVISALKGVWNSVNFAGGDEAARDAVLEAMQNIVPVAKRVNAKFLTVVPGLENPKLPLAYQTASCVELLRRCCDILGPHELVMVLEPLNRRVNHPGVFLSESPHAFLLCRAVDHPSCKILFDVYHQQITEGDLIRNIDNCWSEIAYMQSADHPGRTEPGTGEINYANVFKHLQAKNYTGIVGMEHAAARPGRAGEAAVIDAYRRVDPQ